MVFLESPLLIQHCPGTLNRLWHSGVRGFVTPVSCWEHGNNPPGECKLGMIAILNHINTWQSGLIFPRPMFITASKY